METEKTEEEKKTAEEKKNQRVQIRDVTTDGAEKNKELRYTKRFHMVYRGDNDEMFEGEFTIKRPTIGEAAKIGVMMAEMRQDKPLIAIDRATANTHEWLATCIVCVTQSPPWWDPENMFDAEPLQKCYAEVVAFWNSFRKGSVVK
jgi:hypothetical protein